MKKSIHIFLVIFISTITFKVSAQSCVDYLNSSRSSTKEMVRIYAGPGVVIPRQIECIYCGQSSLMPASFTDPRITITNTVADVEGLRLRSGDKAPNFLGASIQCEDCGGHSPLWELGRPGEAPRPVAVTKRLEILTDTAKGKRYVLLPKEYEELARKDSEMNRLARAQHIAICPSCSVTTMTDSRPAGGLNCPACGGHVPQAGIYNTGDLLSGNDNSPRASSTTSPAVEDVRSIPPKPKRDEVKNGRTAISSLTKKWIAGGATAVSVLLGSTYFYNNTPVIAEGMVVDIKNNVAVVQFQETPYFGNERDLKSYEVQIILNQINSLPGESQVEIEEGDYVTIHYTWSDFHILPFVFHPYSGAEFFDGSFIEGTGIQ